jgi:hypothetical protein
MKWFLCLIGTLIIIIGTGFGIVWQSVKKIFDDNDGSEGIK